MFGWRSGKAPSTGASAPAGPFDRAHDTVEAAIGRVGRSDARSVQGYRFDRFGWIGIALLLVQGLAMLGWSTLLWQRFALTSDYSIYHQAWWLIAHGHLDPFSTLLRGLPFWQNNFELFMWPLALIGVVWSHGPVLLWLQDVCLVGAEVVAWRWMGEVTTSRLGRDGRLLAGTGLALLLANPWAWWAISFDFHMEGVAVLFALLGAYDLAHDRHRAWLWVALTLLCGNAEATWVAGLGLGALCAGRRWWWKGVGLIALGTGWVLFSIALHGDSGGSVIGSYGYLAGPGLSSPPSLSVLAFDIVTHPGRLIGALASHWVDIWANLAPAGLIGIASAWALGPALPILLADDLLRGNMFAEPLFQSVLLYVLVPLGTVLVLTRIARRWPRFAIGAGAALVANAAAWSIIWAPQVPATWMRVSPAAAMVLARADAAIPTSAEVIASQGVAGRFSGRILLYPVMAPSQQIPLRSRDTWWVLAPTVGIETAPSANEFALAEELAVALHARLVFHGHGIWVFHWVPPAGLDFINIPGDVTAEQGWLFPGAAGSAVLNGPPSSWHLAASGRRGYVLAGDYWREPPGPYRASVTIDSSGPVNVEVWNDTGDVLLARRSVPPNGRMDTVSFSVAAARFYSHHLFQGWGPFQMASVPRQGGDRLEIRVWSPGQATVLIKQVRLQPADFPVRQAP